MAQISHRTTFDTPTDSTVVAHTHLSGTIWTQPGQYPFATTHRHSTLHASIHTATNTKKHTQPQTTLSDLQSKAFTIVASQSDAVDSVHGSCAIATGVPLAYSNHANGMPMAPPSNTSEHGR